MRIQKSGHTLLELIIVISIVGMGFVILFPRLLISREKFRQNGCALKQAQLAQAVLRFEAINGRLPVAGITADRNGFYDPWNGPQFSWITLILPELDLHETYDRIDFTTNVFRTRGVNESLPKLICPTDTRGQKGKRHSSGQILGLGNYAAFVAPSHVEFEAVQPGALGRFKPGTRQGQRLAQIVDGASSTLLLSEVRRRPMPGGAGGIERHAFPADNFERDDQLTPDPRGAWALPRAGSSILAVEYHSVFWDQSPWIPDPNWNSIDVCLPNSQQGIRDQIIPCFQPAFGAADGMPCSRASGGWSVAAPRSLHPGGVNAAFVDGRVVFLNDNIDALAYAFLISVEDSKHSGRKRVRSIQSSPPH
ncbi:MAG: DUF1559 domain-containing protein [Planctomycetota bacterium]